MKLCDALCGPDTSGLSAADIDLLTDVLRRERLVVERYV
jgi:hypothetical protein